MKDLSFPVPQHHDRVGQTVIRICNMSSLLLPRISIPTGETWVTAESKPSLLKAYFVAARQLVVPGGGRKSQRRRNCWAAGPLAGPLYLTPQSKVEDALGLKKTGLGFSSSHVSELLSIGGGSSAMSIPSPPQDSCCGL